MTTTPRIVTASCAAVLLACAASASTPGYVEDFVGQGNLGGFGGGSHDYANPGAGGVGGAGDGYLRITNNFAANFGAADFDGNFNGDWLANGVTGVSFWLNDVGEEDAFEIHFAVGIPFVNFWQFNAGFVPTNNEWTEFTIDLTNLDESEWTQIIGIGSLDDALSDVQRILFRHDTAPFEQTPTPAAGDLGLDRITLLPAATPCPGDTNGDNVVDFDDFSTVLAQFGQMGQGLAGDLNGDGVVNFEDFSEVLANFGSTCP